MEKNNILKNLETALDRNFTHPHFENVNVSVKLSNDEKRLWIRIADREIEIDENGKVISCMDVI